MLVHLADIPPHGEPYKLCLQTKKRGSFGCSAFPYRQVRLRVEQIMSVLVFANILHGVRPQEHLQNGRVCFSLALFTIV